MTPEESKAWRPEIVGWSDDILPAYADFVDELPPYSRCVELGVAAGRSLIFLAERIAAAGKSAQVEGVDHFTNPEWQRMLDQNLAAMDPNVYAMISVIHSKTVEAATTYAPASLDLVFIDADHDYEGIRADLEAWGPLLAPGGILAGHDYCPEYDGVRVAVHEYAGKHGLTLERYGHSVWRLR